MAGLCRLCIKKAELRRSHYLPAALFKAVGQGFSPEFQVPILLDGSSGTAIQTNVQPKSYLLCSDCEDKFSKNGERHVIGNCHRDNGQFRLRDSFRNTAASATDTESGLGVYLPTDLPSCVNASAYAYFVLSILWRGSVYDWGKPFNSYHRKLGARYEEKFRLFLLGEVDFPEKVLINVQIDTDTSTRLGLAPPVAERGNLHGMKFTKHYFMIPGSRLSL